MEGHTGNSSTREVEAERSEIQGHSSDMHKVQCQPELPETFSQNKSKAEDRDGALYGDCHGVGGDTSFSPV